jgi:hypothetical protein
MTHRHLRIVIVALVVAAAAGCGPGAPSPSPTPPPAATSFEEYAVGFCAAFDAMFRAVGNPDTGEGSLLSKALDAAVAADDGGTADQSAAAITTELETGRQQVAYARGWAPAAPMMDHMDRVFVAFEAMVDAKRRAANQVADSIDPQAVFEQAGGVESWFALFEAWRGMEDQRPASVQPCANVPVSP